MPKFKPGQSGNPAGRPKGARCKFGEAFLADLQADWQEYGADVIARVRKADPSTYLRVCAGLMPKQLEIDQPEPSLAEMLTPEQRSLPREELAKEVSRRKADDAAKAEAEALQRAEKGIGEASGSAPRPGKPH